MNYKDLKTGTRILLRTSPELRGIESDVTSTYVDVMTGLTRVFLRNGWHFLIAHNVTLADLGIEVLS